MTVILSLSEETPVKVPKGRPYVILSAAMTLDGKIATRTRDSKISCPEDLRRVHELRTMVDAIMVGIGTILTDNPRLTAHLLKGKNPIRVIVDSFARTPLKARAVTEDRDTPLLIAVTENASKEKVEALKNMGAEVIAAGSGKHVDLKFLMQKLRERGIKILMLEGGGTLNWSMVKEGLVDEVRVAIAPIIVGGRDAITLVQGEGVSTVSEGVRLKLQRIEQFGEDLVLTYRVLAYEGN